MVVIELSSVIRAGRQHVSCVVSMPGREGTLSRAWVAPSTLLSPAQALDVETWVQVTIHNWLSTWGSQDVLQPIK